MRELARTLGVLVILAVGIVQVAAIHARKPGVSTKLDLSGSQESAGVHSEQSSSPKIQGVRVTVNAGDIKKSIESSSKESSEVEDSKKKNRVGVRTDVTFNIDGKNKTASEQEEDENASVPVFKGRTTTTTERPRYPYDPRSTSRPWTPSQYHPGADEGYHHHQREYYPQPHPGTTIYERRKDENTHGNNHNWPNFSPITSVWTTERSYQPAFKPKPVIGLRSDYQEGTGTTTIRRWKPCLCSDDGLIWRDENNLRRRSYRHSPNTAVSDKVDAPFSGK